MDSRLIAVRFVAERQERFFFQGPRQALGPTQLPIQWVPRVLSAGAKAAPYLNYECVGLYFQAPVRLPCQAKGQLNLYLYTSICKYSWRFGSYGMWRYASSFDVSKENLGNAWPWRQKFDHECWLRIWKMTTVAYSMVGPGIFLKTGKTEKCQQHCLWRRIDRCTWWHTNSRGDEVSVRHYWHHYREMFYRVSERNCHEMSR